MEIKCLVVKGSDALSKKRTKGGPSKFENDEDNGVNYIRNMPISELFKIIKPYTDLPVIDQVVEDYNIDIDLPSNLLDHGALMEVIKKAGFLINEEMRWFDVLVVTDK